MRKVLTLLFCLLNLSVFAQYSNLAIQDFDTAQTPNWSYTGTGITYVRGNSSSSAGPSNSPFGINGSWAWETTQQSTPDTLTFSNINVSNYDSVYITMRIAAFSVNNTSDGPDALDYVQIMVSVNNGTNYYTRVKITGASSSNSYWAYTATAVATDTFTAANRTTTFAPAGSGSRTADGYSTVSIYIPSSYSQVRIKILSRESTSGERWCIDNITLKGITHNPLPTLTTTAHSSVTPTTATSGGNISSAGTASVTARGVCWCCTPNPTTANYTTSNGTGTGSFTSYLTGLTPSRTYYVRAYATNANGTSYGNEDSFNTPAISIPTLTTTAVTSITDTTASSGGNITSDGGASVSARGVCWSTSSNPTIAGDTTYNGTGTGSFTSKLSGLTQSTTYYARAYATNSVGTAYGNQDTFITITPTIPVLITSGITSIMDTSATSGGTITNDGGARVTARGVCWSTSSNPTIAGNKTVNGNGTGTFTSTITRLSQLTAYHVRAYATNVVGTAYGADSTFVTAGPPSVVTNTINSISYFTANVNSSVVNDGHKAVSTRGACWSTSANPNMKNAFYNVSGSGLGNYTVGLTGLLSNTTYHVRSFAINSVDTAYSSDTTFTTLQAFFPTTITSSPTNITSKGAKVGGSITADGGSPVTLRGICWSTNPNPKANLGTRSVQGSGLGSFNYTITTLAKGITFHVRAFGINSVDTGYGGDSTFTTLDAPRVTLDSTISIDAYKINCKATVTADGGTTVTKRGVCWDTKPGPKANLSTSTNDGTGLGQFTSVVTTLSPGITYYIRAYAINSVDTAYSSEKIYTSPNFAVVTTSSTITSITGYTAQGGGNVLSGNNVSARGIVWGLAANPTITLSTKTTDGSGLGTFSSNITGLSSNTLYHVRAYATNDAGTAYGSDVSFTTADKPTVITGNPSVASPSSASCDGNVTSDGKLSVTNRGLSWSDVPSTVYLLQNKTNNGTGVGTYIGFMNGLNPNTTYYVCAYAINGVDTAFGVVKTFIITPPIAITRSPTDITKTSATLNGMVIALNILTTCYFEYGTSTAYDNIINGYPYSFPDQQLVTASVTGLTKNTTYHYRVVAESKHGKTYGLDSLFTTDQNNSIADKPAMNEAIISTYSNQLKVEITLQSWHEAEIIVTDLSGKELIRQKNIGKVFTAELPKIQAIYLVRLTIDKRIFTQKVIVKD
jgi:hypothetical protein